MVPPTGPKTSRIRAWRTPRDSAATAERSQTGSVDPGICRLSCGDPLDGDVDRRLRPTLEAELGQDHRDRVLDGLLRDPQPAADLAVGQPLTDEREDLALAGGETPGDGSGGGGHDRRIFDDL